MARLAAVGSSQDIAAIKSDFYFESHAGSVTVSVSKLGIYRLAFLGRFGTQFTASYVDCDLLVEVINSLLA